MRKSLGVRDEVGLTSWRIAPERHDVFNAGGFNFVQNGRDFATRMADAGQMRHRFDPSFLFDCFGNLDSLPPRAASCTVGYGDEGRI